MADPVPVSVIVETDTLGVVAVSHLGDEHFSFISISNLLKLSVGIDL